MFLKRLNTIGDVSGAHLNPAVTLGFFAVRKIDGRLILLYIASQWMSYMLVHGEHIQITSCPRLDEFDG
jgi:glycerol uptake facilitator-like aquaporin